MGRPRMDFEISTAVADGGASVISVNGELDLSSVDQVAESARPAVSEGRPLVLDLSACTFIDSSGLRLVLHLHHALAEDGQAMAVAVADGHVRKLFSLTAIDQSVPVFAALGDAVASLGAHGADGATEPRWPLPATNAGAA
jgi:anti-sigma B factor antagonist